MRVLLDEGHIEYASAVCLGLVIDGEYVLAYAEDDGDEEQLICLPAP